MDDSTSKEVKLDIPGLIRVFKDGSVERIFGSPHTPPTPLDRETGVSSKDATISTNPSASARVYLPNLANDHLNNSQIPILLYFHGGGFCLESALSVLGHRYMDILASEAKVLIVSVEYRLAPEHLLPTAYEDCWEALKWTTSLQDPWLANHGDLEAIFLGGDSAGGNIVHNIALRANREGLDREVKLLGAFYSHPYFLDVKDAPNLDVCNKIWELVYPNAPGGLDNYMINPMADGAPSLSRLHCNRILVIVSDKDELRDCGVRYYEAVKKSGFEGKAELFEVKGGGHCFHAFNPDTDNAKLVFQGLASFLDK